MLLFSIFQSSLKEKSEHKEKLEQKNALLEREVQRFHERQKHLDKINLLEKKKPWAVSIQGNNQFY